MSSIGAAANFAKRLFNKHGLRVPVDIENLIKNYADVEFKEFPPELGCFDGVTLNLKNPNQKPKVFINSKQPSRRIKFTLAHELGHIIIPWHTGNIVDNISSNLHEYNEYSLCEYEANEFASEILLPSDWILSLISKVNSIDSLKEKIEYIYQATDLSHSAIAYKVIQYLNPGFVFVVTNDDYLIKWIKTSSSTKNALKYEDRGKYLLNTEFYKAYKNKEYHVQVNGLNYLWYYTNENFSIDYDTTDNRTDNEILRNILNDLGLDSKYITSISSATAFSKQSLTNNLNFDSLLRACYEKLHQEKYNWITSHQDFNIYLYKRTIKLLSK